MREVFEDLKGYEDSYQISDSGRVFTKRRLDGNRIIYGRELSPVLTSDGYLKVTLTKNSESKKFYIHRLVALQFIENKENLPQVNHKDGDKKNNCKNNLEWCTDSDNKKHAYKTGLMTPGNQYSKRIKQDLPRYKLKSTNFN